MTAEIVVMNKSGIALAADSAVTLRQEGGQKIYNTVNKLFALSKFEPVGVMVYGNGEFMGLPWETLIKVYRSNLGSQKYDNLEGYANDFVRFLESAEELFPLDVQKNNFLATVAGYFSQIKKQIDKKAKDIIGKKGEISHSEVEEVTSASVKKHFDDWNKKPLLPHASEDYSADLHRCYRADIVDLIPKMFLKLPINETSIERLINLAVMLFTRSNFHNKASGVVIAGFGAKEVFPVVHSYTIEALLNGKLKHVLISKEVIDNKNRVSIMPFAQSEMVALFMEGVDPVYHKTMKGYMSQIFAEYPAHVMATISCASDREKSELLGKLKNAGDLLLKDFDQKMDDYRQGNHVDPIVSAVAALPIDELAAMA